MVLCDEKYWHTFRDEPAWAARRNQTPASAFAVQSVRRTRLIVFDLGGVSRLWGRPANAQSKI
eukprot:1957595-Rhodomonas_salina.1